MKKLNKYWFAVIGGVLGIPVSYFFLGNLKQALIGDVFNYITHLAKVIKYGDVKPTLFLTMIVMAIIAYAIGTFLAKK